MLIVTPRLQIPLRELEFDYARSAGPGGQNVNKVNTKAVLRWDVARSPSLPGAVRARFMQRFATRLSAEGVLVLQSGRFRSQGRNVADCLERLRTMLLEVARPPRPRRPTRPTRGARERRLKEKRQRARTKEQRRAPRGDD